MLTADTVSKAYHLTRTILFPTWYSADNSPTPEAAREFLRRVVPDVSREKTILGYEFMQDFRVHIKYEGINKSLSYERLPYFSKSTDLNVFISNAFSIACSTYAIVLVQVSLVMWPSLRFPTLV